MKTYISILRGINVSGHKIIKMEALREMFTCIGFSNVQTYIQSGNVVSMHKKSTTRELENKITKEINLKFGFDVPVMVKEGDEFRKIARNNPFIKDAAKDPSFLHVTFLSGEPGRKNLVTFTKGQFLPDQFEIIGKAVYLYCPSGYSNSKLTNGFLEKKLQVTATTRNWKTIKELVNIAEKTGAQ